MLITALSITNYKSFLQQAKLEFGAGFNVLLGANSSGKTTVLEALEFNSFPNCPHRSLLNVEDSDYVETGASAVQVSLKTSYQEVRKLFFSTTDFWLPIGDESNSRSYTQDAVVLKQKFQTEDLCVDFRTDHKLGQFTRLGFIDWPTPWLQNDSNASYLGAKYSFADESFENFSNVGAGTYLQQTLWSSVVPKIYRFSSERTVQHISSHCASGDLLPNGSNLAYCINHLQSNNKDLFDDLNYLLNRVFPNIYWVGAPPNGNNQFELKVHTNPSSTKRGDLAVPINRVGTGVGNALAMLYVALTARTQRFILLEEPNSFLHPRALRELLAILAEIGSKHQFFVTTHSSDVLRTIKASTVTLLEHDGCQTTVKQTSGNELHKFQAGLVDLGIRLTDLHGCDKVLWVEGETEEAIFPLLLRHFFPSLAQGIAVLPLHATGDFEAKRFGPEKVAAIYKKLSEGSFLAPPMVAIALDRERRSDSEINQVEIDCADTVYFLPQTMLEDYLLNVEAVTAVLSQELDTELRQDEVKNALSTATTSESCLLNPKNKKNKTIHAAKVLKSVFESVGQVEYRKTAHGPKIAEWLLANKADEFQDLKEWFDKFLSVRK